MYCIKVYIKMPIVGSLKTVIALIKAFKKPAIAGFFIF